MKTTVFPPDDGYDYFNASPAQVAARASSLIVAARLITNGDSLCDKRFAESICDDLLDVALDGDSAFAINPDKTNDAIAIQVEIFLINNSHTSLEYTIKISSPKHLIFNDHAQLT